MKLAHCSFAFLLAAAVAAPAASLDFDGLLEGLSGMTGPQLETYVQPLADAATLLASSTTFHNGRSKGIAGLDVGVRAVVLPFSGGDRTGILSEVAGDYGAQAAAASGLVLPILSVDKGLIKGFQVGGRFMSLETSKDVGPLSLMGASLRFELNELFHVPLLMPRIGLQGDWSRLAVGDHLETTATSIDLIVSKSFLILEPYGGFSIGKATTNVSFEDAVGVNVDQDVDSDLNRLTLGLNLKFFPMLRLNLEAGLGAYNSYGAGLLFELF